MKRVVGFAMFFMALGMLIVLLFPNEFFICVMLMLGCLGGSYHLFCCR